MLKKNCEKRFHTDAARILISTKLPADFFKIKIGKKRSDAPHLGQDLKHMERSFTSPKDNMLFTFHRESSPAHSEILPRSMKQPLIKQPPKDNRHKQVEKFPVIPLFLNKQNNKQEQCRQRKMHKISSRAFFNRRVMRQARAQINRPFMLKCL